MFPLRFFVTYSPFNTFLTQNTRQRGPCPLATLLTHVSHIRGVSSLSPMLEIQARGVHAQPPLSSQIVRQEASSLKTGDSLFISFKKDPCSAESARPRIFAPLVSQNLVFPAFKCNEYYYRDNQISSSGPSSIILA